MCIYCDTNKVNKIFAIKGRGYGSIFDLEEINLPFCNSCIEKFNIKSEWFDEKPNMYGEYKFENYIKNILKELKNGKYVN